MHWAELYINPTFYACIDIVYCFHSDKYGSGCQLHYTFVCILFFLSFILSAFVVFWGSVSVLVLHHGLRDTLFCLTVDCVYGVEKKINLLDLNYNTSMTYEKKNLMQFL